MPQLDVSSILTDIDFVDDQLTCTRLVQVIGANGLAVNTPRYIKFAGVVTSINGEVLSRGANAELITGSISIITKFRLQDGKLGLTADLVKYGPRTYTVTDVNNYTRYGLGFVEATCELIPLQGTVPSEYP